MSKQYSAIELAAKPAPILRVKATSFQPELDEALAQALRSAVLAADLWRKLRDTNKIPNAEAALIDINKLQNYSLNFQHDRGKHKARLFAAILGLSSGDTH